MKTSQLTAALLLAVAAGAAHAQAIRISVPDDIPMPGSALTRAEVLADFHLWRLAGLQELNRGDRQPDTESPAYRRAEATYAWLRASPQYAILVDELSRRPHATVQLYKAARSARATTVATRPR
jgi:hypothetical protein